RNDEGDRGLADDPGRRDGADVAALDARLGRLLRAHVDRVERLHERGDGLHGRAHHDVLAVRDAALETAGAVAAVPEAAAHVPDDADPEARQELAAHGAGRHARHGAARAGALQHVPQVLAVVLEAAREIGVAGPRAGELPRHLPLDGIGAHDLGPLLEVTVL